jgi:hypothetical protein
LTDFATALRQNPSSAETLIERGRVLERISRREDALTDYTQAIAAAHKSYDNLIAGSQDDAKSRMRRDRDWTIARACPPR